MKMKIKMKMNGCDDDVRVVGGLSYLDLIRIIRLP